MRVLYPVFAGGSLNVVSLRTVPLLKAPPELRAGDRRFPVEEGPPFELAGLQLWNKAEEMASLGRELVVELAWPAGDGSYQALAPLLADERHARAPLKLLSRFRPPVECEGPSVLLGAALTDSGHAPMELTEGEKALVAGWLESEPAVGLFSPADAAFFRSLAQPRPSGRRRRPPKAKLPGSGDSDALRPGIPLSGWRASASLSGRGKAPYPLERSVVELPEESWMKRTAELFGMLPLKWAASGGFFQGSPSSAGWGDVLRALAPSWDVKGSAEGLFPVPVLSGSLLDNAVGAHRAEVFVGEGRPVPSRHVMICGPTGTGKTLLGTFAMLNECVERGLPAVYLGPTRMLVEDAALEFLRLLSAVEREAARPEAIDRSDVLVSTGESFYDDGRIASGDFKAAFIVYEKAGNFFLNTELAGRMGFALVDELHMLGDRIRGGSLDATLARLVIEARTRVSSGRAPLRLMCLSTGAMAGDRCLLEMMSPPGQGSFPAAATGAPAWSGTGRDGDGGPAGRGGARGAGGYVVLDGGASGRAGGGGAAGGAESLLRFAAQPGLIPVPGEEGIHLPQDVGLEDPDAPDAREALGQSPSADPAERLSPGFLHGHGGLGAVPAVSAYPPSAFQGPDAGPSGLSGPSGVSVTPGAPDSPVRADWPSGTGAAGTAPGGSASAGGMPPQGSGGSPDPAWRGNHPAAMAPPAPLEPPASEGAGGSMRPASPMASRAFNPFRASASPMAMPPVPGVLSAYPGLRGPDGA
ncbi:MAG: DEAD/DEAH box helicase, partial [Deltaproteobacteria bacterium]|nr:DEAD/DEAH box helicase [Deltaproteobacteria bacterium]